MGLQKIIFQALINNKNIDFVVLFFVTCFLTPSFISESVVDREIEKFTDEIIFIYLRI